MIDAAPPPIRDADLLAELEAARGTFVYEFKKTALRSRQAERDRLATLSPSQRRRALARAALEQANPSQDDMRHVHSVLAICGLPYKSLPIDVRTFECRQGNMALDVSAGQLRDDRGDVILQPLPYGPKARLILMHLCS